MNLYDSLLLKKDKISVIGLGYVGIVLAISFAKKFNVIGFDINKDKINNYINGIDPTNEVGSDILKSTTLNFTSDQSLLKEAKFHIIAVPTPINKDTSPDVTPLVKASEIVGSNLTKGSIVVYESTVYPGLTEEICVPILEKTSGLIYGVDFKVGYSPERVNPGDKVHTLETTVKIVSGMDNDSLNIISKVYNTIIKAGVYEASSIKIAEAAKIIENSQRDINIAFMNEISKIFNLMDLDTIEVLKAANTKWNFLNFFPGLVGGHCIGVDPYYLTYKSSLLGYNSKVISSGREVNDSMGKYIATNVIKKMVEADIKIKKSNILVLGVTFKENCPDIRNSKVIDIINELKSYDINLIVSDYMADPFEFKNEYNLSLTDFNTIDNIDVLILAVSHDEYKKLDLKAISSIFNMSHKPIIIDIKNIIKKDYALNLNYLYWSL